MLAAASDHARCSENCALIVLGFMIWDFKAFLQNRQKPIIKSSKTYHFADVVAPGVLKQLRHVFFIIFDMVKPGVRCILNSCCTYLIIVSNFLFIFGSVVQGNAANIPREKQQEINKVKLNMLKYFLKKYWKVQFAQ